MRGEIISVLTSVFDVIVGLLEIIIIGFIGVALYKTLLPFLSGNLELALENFLLVLILLEMYELLSLYLKEHHVSMKRIAELGIVAIVRKIMVGKMYDFKVLFGFSAVIFVLGWIYVNLTKNSSNDD
ncbi:phosphate-starvation-inducible PsiE family protein [Pyrococcus kukulkanii]|uniref:phosphate-starvation-inducible PsiE family protein n=1 Tax=Pyrococcus kukulkanii TaxID=1609559 RepID=UPI003567314F